MVSAMRPSRRSSSIRISLIVLLTVVLICIAPSVSGQSAELVGSLRDTNGAPLSGKIDIIQEGPDLIVNSHIIDATGEFRIRVPTQHGLVVHASADGHPPDEFYVLPMTQGIVPVEFELPMGETVVGRIVDENEAGVENATIHIRYVEPTRPLRRAAFHEFQLTDGDGYYSVPSVAIGVPFLVDVHVMGRLPVTSEKTTITPDTTRIENIVVGSVGATLIAYVIDETSRSTGGADVVLIADPAGYKESEHGSLLHGNAYTQRKQSSSFGNVRFEGVPPGRIRVHAWNEDGEVRIEEFVTEGEIRRITIVLEPR